MPYVHHTYFESAGTGRPVIFIHCPFVSHIYWRPIVNRLRGVCQRIAFDLRGHGKSGLGDQPWSFHDISADIALLTRELELEQPILVGYSSGGTIALQAALDEPELYGGLVLVSGFSECSTLYLRTKTAAGLAAATLGLSGLAGSNVISTNAVDARHARAMLPDVRSVRRASIRSFLRETLKTNLSDRLPEIQIPALLVFGADDDLMHGYYRILRKGLPHARTVIVPQTDHRVPTRRPDDFAALLAEFVAERNEPPDDLLIPQPQYQPGATEHQLHS